HASHRLPELRAARRNRIPLRRAGPCALPGRPARPVRQGMGRVPVLPRQRPRTLRRTLEPQRRLPEVVQRRARHAHLRLHRDLPDRIAAARHRRRGDRADPRIPRRTERTGPMTNTTRSPGATGIDTSRPIGFTVDGVAYSGFAGDTIASALIAAGRLDCGSSTYLSRARGILSAGVEESNALVRVAARFPGDISESMLPATRVAITEGLEADYLAGLGILDPGRDEATYEHKHVHTDVLVVGAGPAGLAAAREAGRTGARTLLLDDQPLPGGSLLSAGPATSATIDGRDDIDWIEATVAGFAEAEELSYVPNTTVFGSYDSNYFVALEDRTEAVVAAGGKGTRQRVWHIRAGQVVLATGAHDRPIVFANNDRPGIMLASAVRTYLGRFGVAAGENVAVATTN